jgi:hypothetical protein
MRRDPGDEIPGNYSYREIRMRRLIFVLGFAVAAGPAAAQTHARHTASHDSAHAIMLDDAQHLALHQLLLGRWIGESGRAHHDTLDIRFENDSRHQQLMVRHQDRLTDFVIRGDTLRWNQSVGSTACVASTPVSALLKATRSAAPQAARINGTLLCGSDESTFSLRKVGS